MASADLKKLAQDAFLAFAAGDRDRIEELLADDFAFHAPPDPQLDRDGFFERCWPNAELIESFEFVRVVENGDEVVVTYESTKADGSRFRNTEVLTFSDEQIVEQEVYFGWDI
jgi:ketosteroid isomerase-like protein